MNLSSFGSPSSNSQKINKLPNANKEKYLKMAEKLIKDLEDLTQKIIEIQKQKQIDYENDILSDDCFELQKFCSKLETLLQLKLKEKKSILSSSSSSSPSGASGTTESFSNREYWSFFSEALKSSNSFQDAIKYVKSLNELKTNLGRARAFIRFCLHYHRLADAIQQITMENKLIGYWYSSDTVWSDEKQKSAIIQILYDLNDVNFDLISKNNFELDNTWPTIQLNLRNQSILKMRNRTSSLSSFTSLNIDRDQNETSLFSSTPHEEEEEEEKEEDNKSKVFVQFQPDSRSINYNSGELQTNENLSLSVYYDVNNTNYQQKLHEEKIAELKNELSLRDDQLNVLIDELKKKNSSLNNSNSNYNPENSFLSNETESNDSIINKLKLQCETLTEQLSQKLKQYDDLSDCLVKQTKSCENLSDLLIKNQEKNSTLESTNERNLNLISSLENELKIFKKENETLKLELKAKMLQEEKLANETQSQTNSISYLEKMCSQQKTTIDKLKEDLDEIKQKREDESNLNTANFQRIQISIQLKEEENYLLNDQIQKLSKSLDEERKQTSYLNDELNHIKSFHKQFNEKQTSYISQLEMDNNEIKKRLVKLIKEKADLWQKADKLEYENLLKSNAMWVDDSNVSNCMNCNNGFSLLIRKHHCRVCLKIFCYYCCNNWIEYNNSKLKACQKCFDAKEELHKKNKIQEEVPALLSKTTWVEELNNKASDLLNVIKESYFIEEDPNKTQKNNYSEKQEDNEEEDDDDPDINFEVRAEKLKISDFNSIENLCEDESIYATSNNIKNRKTNISPVSQNTFLNSSKDDDDEEELCEKDKNNHELNSKSIKTNELNSSTKNALANFNKLNLNLEDKMLSNLFDENFDLIIHKKKTVKKKNKKFERYCWISLVIIK